MNSVLILFLTVTISTIIYCVKFESPVKLKNVICDYNETWIRGEYCFIKSHNRNKRSAEIKAFLLKEIRNGRVINNVFKRYSDWKPWVMYNIKINPCEFLSGKNNPYINIIKNLLKKNTSFNHTCPLKGTIIVADLDLRDMAFGSLILPAGEYRLDIHFNTIHNDKIFIFKFFADVWEKRT